MENGMETLILYSPSETAQQVQNKNSNFGSEKLQLVNFFSGIHLDHVGSDGAQFWL